MGQGLLGLIVTQLLIQNHIHVIATDISPRRWNLARDFGACVYSPKDVDLVDTIGGLNLDIRAVIECSGADEAVDSACRLLSRGGTMVIMGATRTQITFSYTQIRIKGATIRFPMNRIGHKDNWPAAADILIKGGAVVKNLVDHRGRLEDIQTILENYEDEWIRVILEA
ncbi:MAG: zinc-binding dehydrogenase [Candidatus Latescibacterota bacterium]